MSLYDAAKASDQKRVQELVGQGADLEQTGGYLERTPLIFACCNDHLEVVRYLLEQGAKSDKTDKEGMTSLHIAAFNGNLEIVKLLMIYGADLNARTNRGQLPIDFANEAIRQASRDEPERRRDQQPRKRCIEEDRQPNVATSASTQHHDDDEWEQGDKQPAELEVGKVADEDQDSEPSSDEDD